MNVAVLGPKGTFSELAASSHFKKKLGFVYCQPLEEVVRAVADGKVEAGVIPVESLREGSVGEALDALAWMDIKIQAEIVLPISHSLLGVKGTKLKKITQVLSHPQALSQCRKFLKKNLPKAEMIEMTSTARAAEHVSKLQRPDMAAVGPKELAKHYGLEIVTENIQSGETNLTRFLGLAKKDGKRTGHDKTSIVFYTAKDKPGILHDILGDFAKRKINLTKIESRPSKKALGDYLFFVDLEGHRTDKIVMEALKGVKEKSAMLKVLGSYERRF